MSWCTIKNTNIPIAARNPVTAATALAQVAASPSYAAIVALAGQAFLAARIGHRLTLAGSMFYTYLKLVEDARQDMEAQKKALKANEQMKAHLRQLLRTACEVLHEKVT